MPALDVGFLDSAEAAGFDPEVPSESEDDFPEKSDGDETTPALSVDPIPPKGRNAPAWTDPDDATLQVSLASDNRLRKLRNAPSEDSVGGREYESRLRRQFENLNPTPGWASSARKKLHPTNVKRRRSSASSGSDLEDEDVFPGLLSSTGGLLGAATKSRALPQETLRSTSR